MRTRRTRWQRCDAVGANCTTVAGSTTSAYPLEAADHGRDDPRPGDGHELRQRGDGHLRSDSRHHGTEDRDRLPAGSGRRAVRRRQDRPSGPPARRSTDITPRVITRETQTITARFHIVACDPQDIRGALVFATPTPYQQFKATEAASGSDGWATLTLRLFRFFPVSGRQQLLAVFVRARKPGEELLGGISSRRLIAFRVDLNG